MKDLIKLTDSKLVLEYQSGNFKAMTILVERWHHKFCKQAYWYTKNRVVAKDIAQDSWKIIIHKLINLRKPEKFGYWALAIVCRKAIDYTRKQSKTIERLKVYHESLINDSYDTDIRDDSVKILVALKSLPMNQQIVLRLFYIENYSLKEIGKSLDLSEGTIKSRLFYAREKLKAIIKPRNYE